jgi:proteic killer suppression protein
MGGVIGSFRHRGTEDVFDGRASRAARMACPEVLWRGARRKLDQIHRVDRLDDLTVPPGNQLERLKGDRAGLHSIRINDQFRICFRWEAGNAYDVEITDYH